MTDKTYKTYNVEAKGTIKLWMDVEASSQEEAEAMAESSQRKNLWRARSLATSV